MCKLPVALIFSFFIFCSAGLAEEAVGTPYQFDFPRGVDGDQLMVPDDNPMTVEKVELGKILYFDPRVSIDGTVRCATCHHPTKGFADNLQFSKGVNGQAGKRNSPAVINTAFGYFQFWDGRSPSLEDQAKGHIANPVEMAHTLDGAVADLSKIAGYKPYFAAAFGDEEVTIDRVARAIASFERTVLSGDSKWDRYMAGDKTAMSDAAVRGMKLFEGKAECLKCHTGFNLSDGIFHNLGVGMNAETPDWGRHIVTNDKRDHGAFKTPTLRDITKTAPYMHDGSQKTLEEVIEFYNQGGEPNEWLDPNVTSLNLTEDEKADLLAYLKALDGNWKPEEEPTLPE